MNPYLWVAMSGADATMRGQSVTANNLANANTTGFRDEMNATRALPVQGTRLPSQVYVANEAPGANLKPGPVTRTGRPLDVAINGSGWIEVQGPNGKPALTRNGDLSISASGVLETAAGNPVLGSGSRPITLPPMSSIQIGVDGTVSGVPQGSQANAPATLGRIRLVNPPAGSVRRGSDGLFRASGTLTPDAAVSLTPRALEGSNVNAVDSMLHLIQNARTFEAQIRLARTSSQNGKAADRVLNI